MSRHVYLGVGGLIVSLLIFSFFTRIPALNAYLTAFLIATSLGYGNLYLSRQGKEKSIERSLDEA